MPSRLRPDVGRPAAPALPRRARWALPLLGALSFGALALGATGCVQRPSIMMHHAEVQGISAYGVSFTIYLQVRNENAYDIQIRHVNCNVVIGRGYVLGPIDFMPNTWLASNRDSFLAVPVTIPWQLMPVLVGETMGAYAIPYQIKGTADVTATRTFGIERDNYSIDQVGSVPRQMVINAARAAMPFAM
jgi:hypothetical protein